MGMGERITRHQYQKGHYFQLTQLTTGSSKERQASEEAQ
jgi:hypothetical protein